MKVVLMLLTVVFAVPIMLIAGFQLLRLVAGELMEMAVEAWRSPDLGVTR